MSKKIKIDPEGRRLGQQGSKAWKKIKQTHAETYAVYMQLAESFQSGRTWAMAVAKTKAPKGAAYNQAMGDWLAEFELTDFDPSDRARLLNYFEHKTEIETHFTAAKIEFKEYHPATLFKKWKAATQAKNSWQPKATVALPAAPAIQPDQTVELESGSAAPLKTQLLAAQSEIEDLKRAYAELQVKLDAAPQLPLAHGRRISRAFCLVDHVTIAPCLGLDADEIVKIEDLLIMQLHGLGEGHLQYWIDYITPRIEDGKPMQPLTWKKTGEDVYTAETSKGRYHLYIYDDHDEEEHGYTAISSIQFLPNGADQDDAEVLSTNDDDVVPLALDEAQLVAEWHYNASLTQGEALVHYYRDNNREDLAKSIEDGIAARAQKVEA